MLRRSKVKEIIQIKIKIKKNLIKGEINKICNII